MVSKLSDLLVLSKLSHLLSDRLLHDENQIHGHNWELRPQMFETGHILQCLHIVDNLLDVGVQCNLELVHKCLELLTKFRGNVCFCDLELQHKSLVQVTRISQKLILFLEQPQSHLAMQFVTLFSLHVQYAGV